MPNIGVVIPAGEGRQDNLKIVLESLASQNYAPKEIVVVCDGWETKEGLYKFSSDQKIHYHSMKKHEPGMEPPRNRGVRYLTDDIEYIWFLDSDVFVVPTASETINLALVHNDIEILCCPYDWLEPEQRDWERWWQLKIGQEDYRQNWFSKYGPGMKLKHELGAALANFSGNLVWRKDLFEKIGGFHRDLSAGRVDDGELGLRAASHGIGTSFCKGAKGYHLWHPINFDWVIRTNEREVPLINKWYPWVEDEGLILSTEDGARFDRICNKCGEKVNSLLWWNHDNECMQKDKAEHS